MRGPIALTSQCCKPPCDEPEVVNIPGPAGNDATGTDGADGISPSVLTTAQFLMPAEGANVSVAVTSNEGIAVGGKMFVTTAGTMQVISKTGSQIVTLQNLENTASGLYPDNAAPTTAIPAGSLMMPTGAQGNAGTLSGAAGGHLKGTYPNPTLNIGEAKGMLVVGNGTDADELSVGGDGTIPHADSGQPLGLQYRSVDLSGTNTDITGTTPIANGGTGATTQQAAINALLALAARGDLIVRNSAGNAVPLTLGTANTVLTSNGTDPAYSKITTNHIDSSFKIASRYTVLIPGQLVNLNGAAGSDTAVIIAPAITRYTLRRIFLEDASTNLSVSAARIGVYTSPSAAGTAIVTAPNSELTSLTVPAMFEDLTIAAAVTIFTAPALYIYLQAAHGSAATVKLWAFGEDLTP